MKNYEVAIDYYDALFNKSTQNKLSGFTLQTQTKIRNLMTKNIFSQPEAIDYFIRHITPDTHIIHGFSKPWEWYTTYLNYPDILEYLLVNYYNAEYIKKSSNDTVIDKHIATRPFTKTNGNKFINLYDENELLQVRQFTNFIINHQLFKCTPLLQTLAYINALTGTPKLALTLYKVLVDTPPVNGNKVQDYFNFFIKSMYDDLGYALDVKYSHGLLTRNILYSKNGDGKSLKSFRMLLSLIINDLGHKSIFDENLSYRKLISNLNRYGVYFSNGQDDNIIDIGNDDILGIIPVIHEYLYHLSLISHSVTVPPIKNIRRSINSGIFILTDNDKAELDVLYKMNKDEREQLHNDIKKTATLLIGL